MARAADSTRTHDVTGQVDHVDLGTDDRRVLGMAHPREQQRGSSTTFCIRSVPRVIAVLRSAAARDALHVEELGLPAITVSGVRSSWDNVAMSWLR